jgi:YVTN family beta-propeller protein
MLVAGVACLAVAAMPSAAAADSVTATIAGAGGSTIGNPLAISPDGATGYTADGAANTVSVISTSTNVVTATVPAAGTPTSLVVSPDGARLYVTLASLDAVLVLDTATHATVATIPVGDGPSGIAISPDGARVYTANVNGVGAAAESVIDTATNTLVATISEAAAARTVAVSPDGSRLFVGHFSPGSHGVTVIDTTTNAVVASIATGVAANAVFGLAFAPDGKRLYGATRGTGTLTVIDPVANTIVGSIPAGATPTSVAVTPDGTRAYVTNSGGGTVSVIDLATSAVVNTIAVGAGATGIGVTPDGRKAYINNGTVRTVSAIALDAFPAIVTASLPAGTAGTTFTASIATTGFPVPHVTVTAGDLPPGLSLDPATGAITGTPTAGGTYAFTVTAASTVSGIAAQAVRSYTLTIDVPAEPTSPTPGAGGGAPAAAGGSTATPPPPVAVAAACVSRRGFTIRIRERDGAAIRSAVVRVDGRRVRLERRRADHRLVAVVDLRGRPRGTYRVEIVVHRRDGTQQRWTRAYRTCAAQLSSSNRLGDERAL